MTFSHMKVAKVQDSHARALVVIEAATAMRKPYEMTFSHMKVAKVQGSHAHAREQYEDFPLPKCNVQFVEGVPVHALLGKLCDGVRAMHRNIRFALHRNGKTQWVDGQPVEGEIWAYFDGDEYATMRLGYADYSVQSGGNKYAVYSRTISNDEFNEGREQYHMAMADSLERALKNVKKHMRRYAPSEIALMSVADFQNKLRQPAWQASSEYNSAYEAVIKNGSFHNEMRSLVLNNYQFNDPVFGGLVKDMLAKLDEQMTRQYEAHHGYYVQVREYLGEQVFDVIAVLFDVIAVLDVKKATARTEVGAHRTYKAEELDDVDENLASRLAALSMLENDAFVEGLGHKVSPTSYWVLK